MDFNALLKHLDSLHKDLFTANEERGVIFVKAEHWKDLSTVLKNDSELNFDYLMCISSYDKGDSQTYGVAYNFYSITFKHYIEVRVEVEDGTPVPSVTHLWRAADWHEREAFDMMGIEFEGHPDLKRILLADDWEGHPLRKDYKEPDYYHGLPVPKDKSYWE